jgi:hypothetical protein
MAQVLAAGEVARQGLHQLVKAEHSFVIDELAHSSQRIHQIG